MPLPLSLDSATAAKSLARESGGTWTLRAWLNLCVKLLFAGYSLTKGKLWQGSTSSKCENCSKWVQFCIKHQSHQRAVSPQLAWEEIRDWMGTRAEALVGTRPAVQWHILLQVSTVRHRPLNDSSLQFQLCLGTFRLKDRQHQATENRAALY